MQRFHQFIWYITIFFVPISIPQEIGGGFSLSFPSEGLMVLCGILGFFTHSPAKNSFTLFKNPITYAILADLAIMLLTSLTSVQPEISVKRLIIRSLFLWVFYVQGAHRFQHEKEILRFWYAYIAGMTVAIFYVLAQHSEYQFAANFAAQIPQPLFAEHAIYGGCLAYLLPFLAIRWLKWEVFGKRKWIWAGVFFLFLFAEYAAASRAAWIGIVGAMLLFIILILRIKGGQILLLSGTFALIIGLNEGEITRYMLQNKAESHNRKGDVVEIISSVTNIQTDVSNMERLNRWGAAWRMIQDKPLLGFGPGTYQFHYAGYQVFSELTRISTRNGTKGNAHSEYITAWVETGFLGFCTLIFLFLTAIWVGTKNINALQDERAKYLQIAAVLGLFTYIIHGGFNSFLDQDEAATLVWSSMAMITISRRVEQI